MSDATPSACSTSDGPVYRAFCQNGRCAKEATGGACGQVDNSGIICDGSDDVRLAVTEGGGLVQSSYNFTNPHGLRFLVVDGQCRFYVLSDLRKEVLSGTLSAEDAELLANDINYGGLERWAGMVISEIAPDCGNTAMMKPPAAAFRCDCRCGAQGGELATAMHGALNWIERIAERGAPLTGPVRAIAIETTNVGVVSVTPKDWPLSRAIAAIPGLITGDRPSATSGALFSDAGEAAALRALRASSGGRIVVVQESGSAQLYQLHVRDELPAAVEADFSALEAAAK